MIDLNILCRGECPGEPHYPAGEGVVYRAHCGARMSLRRGRKCQHRDIHDHRRYDCDKPGLLTGRGEYRCGEHLHDIAALRARIEKRRVEDRDRESREMRPSSTPSNFILRKAVRP